MKTIQEYLLFPSLERQVAWIPKGAEILSVIARNGQPVLHALIDTEAPEESTKAKVVRTGYPVDEDLIQNYVFIGTIKVPDVNLVWHIFVERKGER